MAQPDWMPEGVTPQIGDTQIRAWKKILGVYQNLPGSLTINNPRTTDTLRVTKAKVLAAQKGVSYGVA